MPRNSQRKRKRERTEAKLLREFDSIESIDDGSPEAKSTFAKYMSLSMEGDEAAFAKIRPYVSKLPKEVVEELSDPASESDSDYAMLMSGSDLIQREARKVRSERLRQELLDEGDSPTERLLVDNLVASDWDLRFAQQCHRKQLLANAAAPAIAYWDRRLHACQRRFVFATQALEQFRDGRMCSIRKRVWLQSTAQPIDQRRDLLN